MNTTTPAVPSAPTLADPIPALAGDPGLALLLKASALVLAIALAGDERTYALRAARVAAGSVEAVTVEELNVYWAQLAASYTPGRDQGNASVAANNWRLGLADVPADLVAEAVRLWITGPSSRFPTAGQLREPIAAILDYRKAIAKRGRDLLAAVGEA